MMNFGKLFEDTLNSKHMNNFNVGDIVKLKHGSHTMLVIGEGDDGVLCQWFSDHKKSHTQSFPEKLLILHSEE